jgi:hypothetical protein
MIYKTGSKMSNPKPDLEVAGCLIEFVNGDGSYIVTVHYRDNEAGNAWPIVDKFTFATSAKLKKFLSTNLLGGGAEAPEAPVAV